MRPNFVYGVTALVLAGCSASMAPAVQGVVLVTTKIDYSVGETVSAQLFNRSQDQIGYGACSVRLQRLKGSDWVLIGPDQVPCILVLYVLEPESMRLVQLQLDQTLETGSYRLRQAILPRTNLPSRYIYSPEFRVHNAP